MPEIRDVRFVIAVHDLKASAAFYRDVLGFQVRAIADPGWLFFEKDACLIMAGGPASGYPRGALPPRQLGDHSYFAYLVVSEIDAYYDAVREKGAEIIKTLRDEPWGLCEFGVRTADGHRIMFGMPIRTG